MRIILQHNVDQLGIVGDIVTVRPGYARNYLIPRGLALPATKKNLKSVEHHQRILERRRAKVLAEAEDLATKVGGIHIELERNAGEEGKLFGSMTAKDLETELVKRDITQISRRQIAVGEPIKQLGEYDVTVRIHTELKVQIKVTVTPAAGSPFLKKQAEKKEQAEAEKVARAEDEARAEEEQADLIESAELEDDAEATQE